MLLPPRHLIPVVIGWPAAGISGGAGMATGGCLGASVANAKRAADRITTVLAITVWIVVLLIRTPVFSSRRSGASMFVIEAIGLHESRQS